MRSAGSSWTTELDAVLARPRREQYSALAQLRARCRGAGVEAWNSTFGPDSLYEAWTRLPFVDSIYVRNRPVIVETLSDREDWRVVEIGGGNGALWHGVLDDLPKGTLVLIDPNPAAHEALRRRLPAHVRLDSVVDGVQDSTIPSADVVVCSLTLHHLAGEDGDQRAAFGMRGEGKREILRRIVDAIRPRAGVGVLNEADCRNELDLAPGDDVLVDHFLDVYVRRAGRAVARAIDDTPATAPPAWDEILRTWCLDQVDQALVPRADRDVYELDAASWLRLLRAAGAKVVVHRYTDQWNLFMQYVFR